ncbi:MAG TPA: acyl-ACP thioesterase, partial [Gammaproteobacteria bacterium]|nr:acyl-ACP thioesterase [Gammaproteobacteria bacterium]
MAGFDSVGTNLPFIIHRSNVNAWECDENGHLNARYFIAKNCQGLAHLLAEIGLTPRVLANLGVRVRLVSQHVRFHREALLSLPVTIRGAVLAHDGARFNFYSELCHTANGTLYTSFNSEVEVLDEKNDRLRDVDVADWGGAFDPPAHGRVRSLPPGDTPVASLGEALEMGYAETGRGTVMPEECDAHGRMSMYQYAGRASDSIANFMSMMQSEEEFNRRGRGELGGAVIEYRLDYYADLRDGDRFVIVSGLRSFTAKTKRLSHLIFDIETGRVVAHSQGIAV